MTENIEITPWVEAFVKFFDDKPINTEKWMTIKRYILDYFEMQLEGRDKHWFKDNIDSRRLINIIGGYEYAPVVIDIERISNKGKKMIFDTINFDLGRIILHLNTTSENERTILVSIIVYSIIDYFDMNEPSKRAAAEFESITTNVRYLKGSNFNHSEFSKYFIDKPDEIPSLIAFYKEINIDNIVIN